MAFSITVRRSTRVPEIRNYPLVLLNGRVFYFLENFLSGVDFIVWPVDIKDKEKNHFAVHREVTYMQIDGNAVYRGQTDLTSETRKNNNYTNMWVRGSDRAALQHEANRREAESETYEPTEEGLLLYMEQLRNTWNNVDNARDAANEELKAIKIAHNIMRGLKVPAKDESFLLSKNYKMYMAAKNMAMMRGNTGTAKSVLGNDSNSAKVSAAAGGEDTSIAADEFLMGSGESAIADALTSSEGSSKGSAPIDYQARSTNSVFDSDQEYNYAQGFSTNKNKKTNKKAKTLKRFFYNFKDVSARIVRAKTSGSARQVLTSARVRTAQLRRKLRSGEYDDEAIQLAITHAEAMERVAKKKMKHLLEEEACKRGGLCSGDTEREDIEEQMRQDEQAAMEKQVEGDPGGMTSASGTGQSMPAYAMPDDAGASFEDMSLEELVANSVQSSSQMLDLTSSMEVFIKELSALMKDSMEDMGGLTELAEELMGVSPTPDMDPEDLKELKLKHRTEEQRKIAEADSKYLKALFQKLQREQQAVAQGAAKIAEAIVGDGGAGMISLAGAQTAISQGAASGGGAASGSTAGSMVSVADMQGPAVSEAASPAFSPTANLPVNAVSAGAAVSAVAGLSIDISI